MLGRTILDHNTILVHRITLAHTILDHKRILGRTMLDNSKMLGHSPMPDSLGLLDTVRKVKEVTCTRDHVCS